MGRFLFVVLSLACLSSPLAVAGGGDDVPTKSLVLYPTATPSPALKNRLMPMLSELRPGNAALLWQRAHSPEWFGPLQRYPEFNNMHDLLELPLAKLPRDKAAAFMMSGMLKEMDMAARRSHCDWEMVDRLRDDGFALLIPDVQGFRTYAVLLSLRTRVHLLDHDFDKAVHSLQTHVTLGRHVGDAPILINALVGNAIASLALNDIEELVQVKDSPNLFWALADLPRPLIPLRHALQGERMMIDVIFPGIREALKDPDRPPLTVEQMLRFSRQLDVLGEGALGRGPLALLASRSYPKARQYLLAHGFKADQIEEMPVLQVALMHAVVEYDRVFDETAKWYNQPPWLARAGFKKSVDELRRAREKTPDIFWLPHMIVPAMEKVYESLVRLERRVAVLQTIEAIRAYAAGHDGKLPAALADISDLPLPPDPETGQPFHYTRTEGKALLVAPAPPGMPANQSTTMRFELTVAPK